MARIIVQTDDGRLVSEYVDDSPEDAPIGDIENDVQARRRLTDELAIALETARILDADVLADDAVLVTDEGVRMTWGDFREANGESFGADEFASIARAVARTGRYDEPAGASAAWSLARVT